ncbi:MAG TPA: sulfite exporter TauE/SafE family protein [Vicinamibacterales bacterium]|nr:sulfite exporter TauE/SafE family protein [Vicinamibacterales bacterium]
MPAFPFRPSAIPGKRARTVPLAKVSVIAAGQAHRRNWSLAAGVPMYDFVFDGPTTLAGLLVGAIVGVTGVGGGALMTPILVLAFGVAPHTAVGTDLVFASLTKVFGVAIHHRHDTVDWQVVRRLALGSLPAAAMTLAWMRLGGADQMRGGLVMKALAVALLITAVGMVLKTRLHHVGRTWRVGQPDRFKHLQPMFTVSAGFVLGALVTLTSIGAGALGTVMLVYLYPFRMSHNRLVGTDLAHAIPLTFVAGLGHLVMGNVDVMLLGNLLAGSIPGVLAGSLVGARAPVSVVRAAIAAVLAAVAVRILAA